MRVSLIVTTLNEEASISALLESVLAQSRLPDEMVIVDAGSRDRTREVVASFQGRLPIRLLEEPGCNIARGRNLAIQAASGEIIASTDAGVRLSPHWLTSLLETLTSSQASVVAGFFVADPRTVFERAMGATVLPHLSEIDPSQFLPSSRSVAFTKEAWKAVGGYPDWLDYCEDLIFDLKLKQAGYSFAWAPKALAYFRPRSNLRSFFLQYYRYARGDGKADLWWKRHLLRYSAYLIAVLILAAGFSYPLLWVPLLLGVALYLYRPYCRLSGMMRGLSPLEKLQTILYPPIIRLTGDAAKMLGYPVGLWWRWKHRGRSSKWKA